MFFVRTLSLHGKMFTDEPLADRTLWTKINVLHAFNFSSNFVHNENTVDTAINDEWTIECLVRVSNLCGRGWTSIRYAWTLLLYLWTKHYGVFDMNSHMLWTDIRCTWSLICYELSYTIYELPHGINLHTLHINISKLHMNTCMLFMNSHTYL